jgi:anti-sigma B factor antagonist
MSTFDPFEVRAERKGTRSFLLLSGEFDLACKEAFQDAVAAERRYLAERQFSSLVIDLRGLRFMDSTGLGCLLTVWRDSEEDGFNVHFVPGTGVVERLLSVTRVDQLLPLVEAAEREGEAEE